MPTMKSTFNKLKAGFVITILTGSFAMAQPGGKGGPGEPPPLPGKSQIKKTVKELDKELSLSDEQSEQVSELYFTHFEEAEELASGSSRPDRSEMEALDSKLEKNVNKVLNKDQQKLYAAWLKEQKKERSSHDPPSGGGRPPR